MNLASNQRKHLESLANDLDPIVRIGKQGITPQLINSVIENLESRELIKVKILEAAPLEKEEIAEQIIAQTGCYLVRLIGRTLILYRKAKKKKKTSIELPPKKKA